MFINLVLKEFKNNVMISEVKKSNVLNIISTVLVSLAFIIIEVFLYKMLNDKLAVFEGVSIAFLNIFLFTLSLIIILYLTTKVRKTVYSKEDSINLISKPVPQRLNMAAKIIFIYIKDIIANLLMSFPILMIYASENHLGSRLIFLMILYPFIISIFETGVAYLLSAPYQMIYSFLQKHFILQVISSLILVIALCFAYANILNAFLSLVRNNNIYSIFSEKTINNLSNIAKFLFPTRFYIQILNFDFSGLLFIILSSIIIFVLGTSISCRVYSKTINTESQRQTKYKEKDIKIPSQNIALLKKELALCFEDANSVFSFSSLLVMQPFLTVLVIQAMNTIFKTGLLTYVSEYFPYLVNLIQVLFVILFATFINTSASFVISREKSEGIRICKTIPVSYKKHLIIKMIVPYILSCISLITSIIALLITKQINLVYGLLSLLLALPVSALLELLSINNDLKSPSSENEPSNKSSLISFLSIIIPLLAICLIFILTFVGINIIGSFFIVLSILLIFSILYFVLFYKTAVKKFTVLEMRN